MPIQKACIGFYVKRKSRSRVPTDFGVKSYTRIDFIDDFNESFEKCTYDCRTQVIVAMLAFLILAPGLSLACGGGGGGNHGGFDGNMGMESGGGHNLGNNNSSLSHDAVKSKSNKNDEKFFEKFQNFINKSKEFELSDQEEKALIEKEWGDQ